jgi:Centromere DNA-binding protein complex CBF3 subunit, domain 2
MAITRSRPGPRALTDLLLVNNMLLRCSNRVDIELPDLISLQLDDEGIDSLCWPLVLVMRTEKTNQIGKIEQMVGFLMYPQGILAIVSVLYSAWPLATSLSSSFLCYPLANFSSTHSSVLVHRTLRSTQLVPHPALRY